MTVSARIEDLRRRVQKDPASIAFAQLAEECRRAGQIQEAIDVCRGGLAIHPGYLSARVTLGRALIEINQLDDALHELQIVLQSAPENLAAIRGVAEVAFRRGAHAEALVHYRIALALAKNDPELQERVTALDQMTSVEASKVGSGMPASTRVSPEADGARRMIAVLEQWLGAIHVTRAERHA